MKHLPEGQRYYPSEQYTDQPERFLVAELIRERILMETGEEVPYASAVVIERYEEPPAGAKPRKDGKLPVTSIAAAIYCERTGQKAILIGKGGSKLKAIGASARKEIESLLGTRVFLELMSLSRRTGVSRAASSNRSTGGGSSPTAGTSKTRSSALRAQGDRYTLRARALDPHIAAASLATVMKLRGSGPASFDGMLMPHQQDDLSQARSAVCGLQVDICRRSRGGRSHDVVRVVQPSGEVVCSRSGRCRWCSGCRRRVVPRLRRCAHCRHRYNARATLLARADAKGLHLAVQVRAVEAEGFRGATHIAVALVYFLQDVVALVGVARLLQRVEVGGEPAGIAMDQHGQVLAFDAVTCGFRMTSRSIRLRSSRTLPGQ